MKEIKYWSFNMDNGSNYGTLRGKFSSLENLKYYLEKSEALRNNLYSLFNSHGKYIDKDLIKVKVDIYDIEDDYASIDIYSEGHCKIRVKVGETKEIKEEGKPYSPSNPIYEEQDLDLSTIKYSLSTYLKTIKLDGIPVNYGEMEAE